MQPYHEYVNFMLRQFFSDSAPADDLCSKNCAVCQTVLQNRPGAELDILRDVFSGSDKQSIRNAVNDAASKYSKPDVYVWRLVRDVSREIARVRGLI